MISRRTWLTRTGGAALLALAGRRSLAAAVLAKPTLIIYKDPSCGCCGQWIDYVRANGFAAEVHNDTAMDAVKTRLGVPASMRSCHTAQIGGYLVEGHVPVADMQRMLKERPKIMGLATPGMPMSAPGMLQPGARVMPYDVMAFQRIGSARVYAHHTS